VNIQLIDALRAGAVSYLVKPFEQAELLAGINLALQRQEIAPRSPPAPY
jgi:DNA-binding response OmpR family regulator